MSRILYLVVGLLVYLVTGSETLAYVTMALLFVAVVIKSTSKRKA